MQLIPLDSLTVKSHSSDEYLNGQLRMPAWLKAKTGKARQTVETSAHLQELRIVTVCEEARCPNIGECWSHKTATFMEMFAKPKNKVLHNFRFDLAIEILLLRHNQIITMNRFLEISAP